MAVTGPMDWLSLAGCMLLICIAVFWGFRGEIPTHVRGQGILITQGAVRDVVSSTTGRIEDLRARLNETVRRGQVLASLSRPDLELQINEAAIRLKNLEAEKELVHSLNQKSIALKRKYLEERRQALEEAVALSDIQYRRELSDISAQEADLISREEKDLVLIQQQISHAEAGLDALKENLRASREILCPHNGKVLEVFKGDGELIKTGEPLLSIECVQEEGDRIGAILYFSPADGKRIKAGMRANIAPSVARKEEYGFVLGDIHQVSGFPATQKGMLQLLKNENLVQRLSRGEAPILVTANLLPNPKNPSGFQWSSGLGPPIKMQSGTLCSADVVIDTRRPIDLVLPFLRRHLFGVGEEDAGTAK